jgi:hypothetical protein
VVLRESESLIGVRRKGAEPRSIADPDSTCLKPAAQDSRVASLYLLLAS